ncbi:hypothetical protein [Maridesulfovibrio hydrothermalis]|uniref:Uncharacterized protein n=1 Tax=Maridesulfovibrio hydrothermalis AM13 = DSM 14728 TaxID=1121451 RepID=L0RAY0_9BACT|nr:hypothetical protein [Maridesulfovibrio hydrothermalis]CCO22741.1 conserved exported protein of unknown function [Maridesulfovibrio hydrothermalis AM13 = DSM 14728]
MNTSTIKEFIQCNRILLTSIAVAIILIVAAYGVFTVQQSVAQEKARVAEEIRVEQERVLREKQDAQRRKVVESMKRLIETGHAETALAVAEKNKELMNDELRAMIRLATEKDLLNRIERTSKWNYSELAKYYAQLASLEPDNNKYSKELKGYDKKLRKRLERKLYAQAQALPMKDFKANMDIYEELMQLNPEEKLYKSKYNRYKRKYDSFMKELEKFGPKPRLGAQGKSYLEVEQYLKANSVYPETLQMESATDCYYTDSGWLVGCTYSEQDEVGTRFSEFLWFTISNSTVQKVESGGAYTVN